MAKVEQFLCDECGRLKEAVNHWFNVSRGEIGNQVLTRYGEAVLIFSPFNPDAPRKDLNLCGHACAQKVLERWMAEQRS